MSSTAACAQCGHRPNAAYQLYAELSNEKASWIDATFWIVVGATLSAGLEVLLEQLLGRWAR